MRASSSLPNALLVMVTMCATAAGAVTFQVDPAKSQVLFTLEATGHTVKGEFKVKSGAIQYDPVTGAASGAIAVDAASGTTGNATRDRRMREQVLEAQKFPLIEFIFERISRIRDPDEGKAQIEGSFKIHGAVHPLSFTVFVTNKDSQFQATGSFSVPYVRWGMKDPSNFLLRVKPVVAIEIRLAGTIAGRITAIKSSGFREVENARQTKSRRIFSLISLLAPQHNCQFIQHLTAPKPFFCFQR